MKKSVRIRKALPGEKPGYYNKTAKFLKKAQMGMEVSSVSRDPERMNLIYENVYGSLRQSMTPDIVYNELITEYALDQQTALQIIQAALNQLAQEGVIDPEVMNQTQQKQEEDPSAAQDQQQADEEQQRASDDAEQEELAMSDEGYYDEEEAQMNDNSHLETEEDEQQQAFRFGGYRRQEGGEADEYSDYQDVSNESQSGEEATINQYNNPGQNKMEKPFSIEDLMAVTPGMQGQEAFPDLSYYLGDYRPVSDSYQPMDYLPAARRGGQLPKAQDGGSGLTKYVKPVTMGLDYFRRLNPMTNLSGIRKSVPVFSTIGEGMTRLPWLGSKFGPQLSTTFTQNRNELWNVLNGAEPSSGIFGAPAYGGSTLGGADLQANRLMLYQDDVKNIIQRIERSGAFSAPAVEEPDGSLSWSFDNTGPRTFTLGDINPIAQQDGLVSGVYPMDAKVIGGTDDNGFKFFELKHTFGPNQTLPFGTTSSKAKELTIKNRFYYSQDPETGEYKVFDVAGNPLSTGAQTKYQVQRPIIPSLTGQFGNFALRDNVTPFPNYQLNFGVNETGPLTSKWGTTDITGTAPRTLDRMGWRGYLGRGLENYALGTWIPQMFGLGNPLRSSAKNVTELSYPTYGYRNPALGPDVIDPAKEGSYASDIRNAINYKYRLGLKTTLIGGGLGYLGYKTYDAFANPCQCDYPSQPNYMKKDAFGNCPCGTDVGPIRTLDPTGVPNTEQIDQRQLTFPDSMQFLIQRGIAPTDYNYWRYRDSLDLNKSKNAFSDDYSKGGITKNQFVKKFTAKFQEGGDSKNPALGKGKRMDTLTNDVEARKDIFKNKLKDNSNIALTEEIYKNAQSNPQILNMLMQDGPKKNLAENDSMGQGMPMKQYGGNTDNDVPSWYTGYKGMMAPKQYRKLFREMKRMVPRGNDISRANLASSMYNKRFMQPGFGQTMTYPDYMNMLIAAQTPLITSSNFLLDGRGGLANAIERNTPVYGDPMRGGAPSQVQADDATMQNIMKNMPLLPSMTPDFVDSPLVGNPQDVEDFFKNKRAPIVGETWDTWYTSDGSTPGFAPDTRTWDGTQWVGPDPVERLQLQNHAQGGFVDMDAENPLTKFIYGGDEAEYYEPYGIPMAQDGIEITNQAGENRMVADVMPFDEWAEGEKEDFATTHPGVDFDTWKAGDESGDDYQKYADFHNKSLQEYQDFGKKPPVQTNGNCPAGYKWDGTKCVLIQNTNTQTKCGPGTVWNPTYKACIPVAQINYNPRVVRGQSGLFRNLAPWNPIMGYAGSWTKQMTLPYYLGNKNPYMGQLPGAPVARYVTKKGILGRPKKWIDIYETSGNGAPIDPLKLEELMNQRQGKNRNQSNKNQSNQNKESKLSRREQLEEDVKKRYGMSDEEWESTDRRGKRRDRIAERYLQGRGMRYRTNQAWENLKDSALGDAARFYGNIGKKVAKPFMKKEFGGAYMQMGGYNPFELGSGFSTGIGMNSSAFAPHSADAQFQNDLFGGKAPSAAPPKQQNPFAFLNTTGTGSYAETANTGHTLGAQGQEIIPQKEPEAPQNEYVGVENKRKDMWNIDPEAGVNVFNAGARGVLGVLDRRQNAKRERDLMLNTTDPMNLYASATEQDRGDWVDIGHKSGLYRYDQQGQDRSSRATFGQYGGYMQDGGFYDPYFEEDEEVYMTPEELEQFLQAGGQVEYL